MLQANRTPPPQPNRSLKRSQSVENRLQIRDTIPYRPPTPSAQGVGAIRAAQQAA